jgi:hypothetical protein
VIACPSAPPISKDWEEDVTREDIAKVSYQVNRAYCESLGDFSFGPWEEAPEWQRAANRAGVNFHLCHPEAPPSVSHEAWLAMKVADGWTWGPKKDPVKKEHPCIDSFLRLPRSQQAKDFIFKAVVESLKGFLEIGEG